MPRRPMLSQRQQDLHRHMVAVQAKYPETLGIGFIYTPQTSTSSPSLIVPGHSEENFEAIEVDLEDLIDQGMVRRLSNGNYIAV